PPRLSTWWRTNPAILAIRENWQLAVIVPFALAATGALIWLLWLLLTGLITALGAAGSAIGDTAPAVGAWITDGPITRSISEPMRAWLDTNTAGLPATGRDAWITWLVAICVLYAAAVAGSSYARIGWAVIGALTAAAVHAGAPEGTGLAAAGLTVAVWLLLSLLAYAGPVAGSAFAAMVTDLTERRAHRTI
ncbi:hypothetical protein, partial [Salinispora mooreana]